MHHPRGFTITEILVALAIMAVLGALIVPTIFSSVDRARADGAVESLEAIGDAVALFADRVNEYPATLTQLVEPITAGDTDICGAAYTGGEQNRWDGPYLDRAISATGVPLGVGTAANALGVVSHPSGIDYLAVQVDPVLEEDAEALDHRIDDGDGATAGALRWTAPASGFVTASYLIPFPDC